MRLMKLIYSFVVFGVLTHFMIGCTNNESRVIEETGIMNYKDFPKKSNSKIVRTIYRSQKYYDDWIAYREGDLYYEFKCDMCGNDSTKIHILEHTDFKSYSAIGFLNEKSLKKQGGFFEVESNDYYCCSVESCRLIKCENCGRKYMIVFGYNEHQPGRDVYKLLSIFELY